MSTEQETVHVIEGPTYVFTENGIRLDGTSTILNPVALIGVLAQYLNAAARRGWPAREQRGLRIDLGHERNVLNAAFDAAIEADKE